MGAVMMRHSKSQQYLDGRPLVKMAPRTIEYKGFALACEEEKYVLTYLGAFAADALQRFLEENRLLGGAAGPVSKAPMYMRIKSLLPLISRAITHTETINLQNLDHLRRMFNASRAAMAKLVSGAAVQILPPDAILQILQSAGQGALGGSSMNRSTNRTLANTAAAQDRERRIAHYEHFDVKQVIMHPFISPSNKIPPSLTCGRRHTITSFERCCRSRTCRCRTAGACSPTAPP